MNDVIFWLLCVYAAIGFVVAVVVGCLHAKGLKSVFEGLFAGLLWLPIIVFVAAHMQPLVKERPTTTSNVSRGNSDNG